MAASDPNKVALIIGIDEYIHKDDFTPLPSCRKDADDIADLLQRLGYTIFHDKPIIGSYLDRETGWVQVHKAIRDFFKEAQPNQTLLFYFSGHGLPREDEIYLATPQVDPHDPIVEGYSLSNLAKLMKSSKSKRIVSVIDACHSGAARLPDTETQYKDKASREETEAGIALATYDKMLDNIPKGEGRYFLLSSQGYQKSFALTNDNSLYTKYLIEGLKGASPTKDANGREIPGSVRNDGTITPESLHEYVYFMVASSTDQIPKLKVDKSSSIVLAYYPKPVGSQGNRLIDSCEELLKLGYSLSLLKSEDEVKFWDSFKEFYWHANKSKQRYKIGESVDKLTDLKANVESAWEFRQRYREEGSQESETESNKKVLRMYASIIEEVEKIKEKLLEIESKKIEKISSEWARQFLTTYYKIITYASNIDSITSLMETDTSTDVASNKMNINAGLLTFQTQLSSIVKAIEFLRGLENPESISRLLSSLYQDAQHLLDLYKKEGYRDPAKIIMTYENIDFSASIKLIYREAISRVTIQLSSQKL